MCSHLHLFLLVSLVGPQSHSRSCIFLHMTRKAHSEVVAAAARMEAQAVVNFMVIEVEVRGEVGELWLS